MDFAPRGPRIPPAVASIPETPDMPKPWQTCLLAPALALLLPEAAADAESRVALVVGNTDYRALQPLRTAAVDARQLASALERLGFETTHGVDLGSEEFALALQDLAREAGGADAAVFVYFGHGQQVDALNYLLPTDFGTETTPDVQLDAVALRTAVQAAAQAEVGVVLVDAGRPTGLDIPGAEPGLVRPQSLPPGVVVGFSAEPGETVEGEALFQSVYGAALAEAVTERGLPLGGMLQRVRQSVINDTGGNQRPVVFGPAQTVEFSFNPAPPAPQPRAEAEPEAEPDAEPEVVEALPEDRAPAGLPAQPEPDEQPTAAEVRTAPEGAAEAAEVDHSVEAGEPLIEQAADAAPEAHGIEMDDAPRIDTATPEAAPGGPDPDIDVEVDVEPPDRADTRLAEPPAETVSPDALPAEPLAIPTEPGGAASDVDVGEIDPETPRETTATPDADGIAPAPAGAREEVETPERPAPQAAARPDEDPALLQSPDRDPPLSAEQRRAVQRSLRILGHYDYYIDAVFGTVTRAGIRAFQERIGAEPTGHLSPAQIDRLHAMAEQAG